MHPEHVDELLRELPPSSLVLDVGGWACPFNRADWVIDAEPFETRGCYRRFGGVPSQGGEIERFSKATWVTRDICSSDPWPFSDKQFDFAICSHTLEDLRDPLRVCAELIRVAKAGYIEVPSRAQESCLGVERPRQAGLSHHRWLIEIDGTTISFLQKFHMIHSSRRFHLPKGFGLDLPPERRIQWLWWKSTFDFREIQIHGLAEQEAELERFAALHSPCPFPVREMERAREWIGAIPERIGRRLRNHFRGARPSGRIG